MASANLGAGRSEAEGVDEDQAVDPVAVVDREPGSNCAADRVPDQRGRGWAGCFDQLSYPVEHPISVQAAVLNLGSAQARKVRDDHPIGRDQPGNHA